MNDDAAVRSWIDDHAHPISLDPDDDLSDLTALHDIVGDAPVVGLGAADRAGREITRAEGRILRFLVEHLGFRVLAIEDSWTGAAELDRAMADPGADLGAALVRHAWPPWHRAEVLVALNRLRRFGVDHPDDPVRIVGADVAQDVDPRTDLVVDLVARTAPQRSEEVRVHYTRMAPAPAAAPAHARAALDVVAALRSTPDTRTALDHALSIVGWADWHAEGRLAIAEHHLARNVVRAHRRTGARVVYWGGLAHVAAADHRVIPMLSEVDRSAGGLLREHLGDGYVPIGVGFDHGETTTRVPPPPAHRADAVLGEARHERFLLDLRAVAPDAVRRWREEPTQIRAFGPGYTAADDERHHLAGGSLSGWLAAVVHIRTVTPDDAVT